MGWAMGGIGDAKELKQGERLLVQLGLLLLERQGLEEGRKPLLAGMAM